MLPKALDGLLPLALGDKDDWSVFPIQIDEDGHVAMPTPAGGLIQAEGLKPAEIHVFHCRSHVVVNDSPETFVRRAHKRGDGGHRHLPGQGHDNVLKEQGKATARSCPRDCNPAGATVRATHSRHARRQVAVMLEEVEVAPREFQEVMGLAVSATARTGMTGAPVRAERQMEFVRNLLGVQSLAHNLPGRCQSQAKGEDVLCAHAVPPEERLPPLKGLSQFHVARRRTHYGKHQYIGDGVGNV